MYQILAYKEEMDAKNVIAKEEATENNLNEKIAKVEKEAKRNEKVIIEVMKEFAPECFTATKIYFL